MQLEYFVELVAKVFLQFLEPQCTRKRQCGPINDNAYYLLDCPSMKDTDNQCRFKLLKARAA